MSFVDYLKETKSEMRHVSWPSKNQVINLTLLVLGFCAVVAGFLGLFDWLFSVGLRDVLFR